MRPVLMLAIAIYLTLANGCANFESAYVNIYEGLKTRETFVHPDHEQKPSEKTMPFRDYETERIEVLNRSR